MKKGLPLPFKGNFLEITHTASIPLATSPSSSPTMAQGKLDQTVFPSGVLLKTGKRRMNGGWEIVCHQGLGTFRLQLAEGG